MEHNNNEIAQRKMFIKKWVDEINYHSEILDSVRLLAKKEKAMRIATIDYLKEMIEKSQEIINMLEKQIS